MCVECFVFVCVCGLVGGSVRVLCAVVSCVCVCLCFVFLCVCFV